MSDHESHPAKLPPQLREVLQFLWNHLPVVPLVEIPNHLRGALARCLKRDRLWARIVGIANEPHVELLAAGCRRLEEDRLWDTEEVKNTGTPADETKPAQEEPKPPKRLTVSLERKVLTLDGDDYEVKSVKALRWVQVLAKHPGEWISGADLERYDPELMQPRTHRLTPMLPAVVRSLIDSKAGAGSRIRL